MEITQQWKVYSRYLKVNYSLKHWFDVQDSLNEIYNNQLNGIDGYMKSWGKPHKIIGNLHFRYLWKNNPEPVGFDEFIDNTRQSFNNSNCLKYWEVRL